MTLFLRMSLEPNHNDVVLQYDDAVEYETGDVEYERSNVFYKDDAELPEVETLYEPGDSRQDGLVARGKKGCHASSQRPHEIQGREDGDALLSGSLWTG